MITILTLMTALGCVALMTVILFQDPKTGNFSSSFTSSELRSMINQGKSSQYLEKITWSLATVIFALSIITAVIT